MRQLFGQNLSFTAMKRLIFMSMTMSRMDTDTVRDTDMDTDRDTARSGGRAMDRDSGRDTERDTDRDTDRDTQQAPPLKIKRHCQYVLRISSRHSNYLTLSVLNAKF
jgi:hypothetical protein